MARERATKLVGPRCVTIRDLRRSRCVACGSGEQLRERRERLLDMALQPRMIFREHVDARRELRLERTESRKVFEVFDLVVVAQARNHAGETRCGNDRELGGSAAPAAMFVEQGDEAIGFAPEAVVNFEPETSPVRGIVAPRAARTALESLTSQASPRGSLFGIGVQARIVLERRTIVARLGEGPAPRPRVEAPEWRSFSGRSRTRSGEIEGGRDLCG